MLASLTVLFQGVTCYGTRTQQIIITTRTIHKVSKNWTA